MKKISIIIALTLITVMSILGASASASTVADTESKIVIAAAASFSDAEVILDGKTTEFSIEIPYASTILGVKSVTLKSGETASVTINGENFPLDEKGVGSVTNATGIKTTNKNESTVIVEIKSADGKTTKYTIKATKSYNAEVKVFNDMIAGIVKDSKDPKKDVYDTFNLAFFSSYLTRFSNLPNEYKLQVENATYFGASLAVVKTGSTTLNVDNVMFDTNNNGQIDLPIGASSFTVVSLNESTDLTFTVAGKTYKSGEASEVKPSQGDVVVITAGDKTYNLSIGRTEEADAKYLMRVIANLYTEQNIGSLAMMGSMIIEPRLKAISVQLKEQVQVYEAELINAFYNDSLSDEIKTAIGGRIDTLSSSAKSLVNVSVAASSNNTDTTTDTTTNTATETISTEVESTAPTTTTVDATSSATPESKVSHGAILIGVLCVVALVVVIIVIAKKSSKK